MKTLTLLMLLCCVASKSFAQPSDHVDLKLQFRPDSTLAIVADYTLADRKSDTIFFVLNPGIQPLQINADGLQTHTMGMVANRPFPFRLLVFDADSPQENLKIKFEYTINLKQFNHINSNWIELNVDKIWVPNANDLDNRYTWKASIEGLYDNYSLMTYTLKKDVISPMVFMNPDATITIENQEPSPEVFIMAGADMQLWEAPSRKGKTKIFVSKKEAEAALTKLGKKTDEVISLQNKTFKHNPVDEYLLVMRNTKQGEIDFLQSRGTILLGNTFAGSYASLAHEISHYWWSKADFINEPWMNEAFANYSMLLTLEQLDKELFEDRLGRIEAGAQKGGSISQSNAFDPNGTATNYQKGALLLWNLDAEIGRQEMTTLLRSRIKKGLDTTSSFLGELESQLGASVRSSFESKLD